MIILHIISGLTNGGAESVLYRLCLHDKAYTHIVVSLMDEGKYGSLLREAGVEVHCLNMASGRVTLPGLVKLFRLLRSLKPDAVQTWMYHADLIGGVMARLAGIRNINWGIHHTILDPKQSKGTTILAAKLCAKLSRFVPKKIVFCAQKSLEVHRTLGYAANKLVVANNGYDLSLFFINSSLGDKVREEFNLDGNSPLLGLVGRFDPLKDHHNLVSALSLIKQKGVSFKCLLIGAELNRQNSTLNAWLAENDLKEEVLLLDQRSDIPAIMNALDIHVLSSFSEAFPNVLCEAMACGTPCVTTDVGDTALIVGKTGWVVPPKNPQALADTMITALDEKKNNPEKWAERKTQVRKRVEANFSIEIMIANYHSIWFGYSKEKGSHESLKAIDISLC